MRTVIYYFPLTGTLLEDIKAWLKLCNEEGKPCSSKRDWEIAAAKVAKGMSVAPVDLDGIDIG